MQVLIRSPRGGWILSAMSLTGIVVFAYAIGVLMLPYSSALGDRLAEMTCLQLAFTPVRATSIIMSFTADQQVAMGMLLIPGDVTFAWSYGLLMAGLVGLLARRLAGAWCRIGAVVMWVPIAASLLDVIEDLFLYASVSHLLDNPAAILMAELPMLAGIAATLKYLALLVVTPAYSIAGILHGLRVDRSAGALVVYFLLLVVCINMLTRPLQHIPACF